MNTSHEPIRVECYAGHRGEETPRRFFGGDRLVEVVVVADSWLEPDCRYFKVVGDDGRPYLLKHRPGQDDWLLIG